MIASELWVEASLKNHPLVMVEEAVLRVVDGKVAVLEDNSG